MQIIKKGSVQDWYVGMEKDLYLRGKNKRKSRAWCSKIKNTPTLEEILAGIEKKITSREELSWFNLHMRRFKETLLSLLESRPPPAKVVELGSFPGYLSLAMRSLGYDVTGVDLEPDRIIVEAGHHGIKFFRADLEKVPLPFEDSFFDCAILTEVIEHIAPRNVPSLISEINRILRMNGTLILSTPNVSTIDNYLLKLIGKATLYKEHKKEYTMSEIVNMVGMSGFKIARRWYSLNRDVATHYVIDNFISKDHVVIGFFKKPNWKNFGRLATLPIKYLVPSTRSTIFVIAIKNGLSNQYG